MDHALETSTERLRDHLRRPHAGQRNHLTEDAAYTVNLTDPVEMPEKRKKYDREFREGAVRIVEETGKPIAAVARDLGVHEGTLGNWVARAREAREGRGELTRDDLEELKRLRREVAELRMERDVLKRSVVLWVKEATK
ncbi:hypothetical protein MPOR_36940 [Mycolicibacterium poriferae]|uniref:Transposase n=2 Tax=Mycolicibacterium poriferae TaxID=39694 RepID=A0A6N4VEZ1_9MYCO|nr:hypothetical protein MPOR_36940 [Mycolicibacterium poriferae]